MILVTHGNAATPHTFRFKDGSECQAAVFVGCDAGATNKSIKIAGRDVPGAKMTNGEIQTGLVPPAEGETHWRTYWHRQALEGAAKLAKDWIDSGKTKEVTIYRTKSSSWSDYFSGVVVREWTVDKGNKDTLKLELN